VTIDPAESVFRLLLVFALAFGIGLERQIRQETALKGLGAGDDSLLELPTIQPPLVRP